MKIIHIADLHFGKALHGRSLIGDQREWAERFISFAAAERPDAVVIAGDVYDRAAPSAEAVELLDFFLTGLLSACAGASVMVVAGNHDSGPKLAFGASLLSRERLFIAGRTLPRMMNVELEDRYGKVLFWLMPYTFPAAISEALGEEAAERGYTASVRRYLEAQCVDASARNVLVAHQSVSFAGREPENGGSETMIGGIGSIDGSVFGDFDYVALGHIHKAQHVGRDSMRYAGSPLAYHFDETRWPTKGAVVVELLEKGRVEVRFAEIESPCPLRVVEGPFDAIIEAESSSAPRRECVKIVLTDRRANPADCERLRAIFAAKGASVLEISSSFRSLSSVSPSSEARRERTLSEMFEDFWAARHDGARPDDGTLALVRLAAGMVDSCSVSPEADAAAIADLAAGRAEP